MRCTILLTSLLLVFVGASCAKRPPLQTDAPVSSLRAAEEVGAKGIPQASLHMQLAKEELEKAKKLDEEGDDEEAKSMSKRSETDAELAVLLTREEEQRKAAAQARARLEELKKKNPGLESED